MQAIKTKQGIEIACQQGDIASQTDMEGVVNAANAQLRRGGGVAGAIHQAAGPELEEECRPLAPIQTGEAVLTSAHRLPNDYVIHALGPVYQEEEDPIGKLKETYSNALFVADEKGLTSLAFPAISTGVFGFPFEEAALAAMEGVRDTLDRLSSLRRIRFVLYGEKAYDAFGRALEKVFL